MKLKKGKMDEMTPKLSNAYALSLAFGLFREEGGDALMSSVSLPQSIGLSNRDCLLCVPPHNYHCLGW